VHVFLLLGRSVNKSMTISPNVVSRRTAMLAHALLIDFGVTWAVGVVSSTIIRQLEDGDETDISLYSMCTVYVIHFR
jgi:hypothetical protein